VPLTRQRNLTGQPFAPCAKGSLTFLRGVKRQITQGGGVFDPWLSDPKCRSVGDALIKIDRKFIVRNEFILITSFVISNARLIPQT
jgi:hypothetical protein